MFLISELLGAWAVLAILVLFIGGRLGWYQQEHCSYPEFCPVCKAPKRNTRSYKALEYGVVVIEAPLLLLAYIRFHVFSRLPLG